MTAAPDGFVSPTWTRTGMTLPLAWSDGAATPGQNSLAEPWRADGKGDYGALDALAAERINTGLPCDAC
jgi:hypothetical protein